tara:strand:+ start:3591 stop:3908 length:318 start_codon:yes stop_codon:yes gene_type:complete
VIAKLRLHWFLLTKRRMPICWITVERDTSDWDCKNYWLGIKSELFGDSKYLSYCRGRIKDMEKMGLMAKQFFPRHQYQLNEYGGIPINHWSRDLETMEREHFGEP